ncbi:BPTI/Kunitz domain-containing protein 4-like [Haliotis rubra]|uniref:BPTI/Kunitz domain-containing protein 4-like n=1 Tax=Haliotis rubra TaxID=36100 RepID=UPI001EE6009B|nr:BPTI/Kunitz domain-containing protein 4-like [Haliotis rubra]
MKVVVCLLLAVAAVSAAPSEICGPVCMIYCPFGNVLDSSGCPTCKCNWPEPSDAPEPAKKAICFNPQMALCDLYCPTGRMAHDSQGCPICRCETNTILP